MSDLRERAINDVAEALKCTVDEVKRDAFHCEIHAYAVSQRERVLQLEEALRHGRAVVDAMEYCHICKGQLVIDEGPHRCEDCSADCEDHGEPDCIPFDVLFEEFKRFLKILEGK